MDYDFPFLFFSRRLFPNTHSQLSLLSSFLHLHSSFVPGSSGFGQSGLYLYDISPRVSAPRYPSLLFVRFSPTSLWVGCVFT